MRLFFTLFIIVSISLLHAQKPEKGQYKRLSVDVYAGMPIFFGDIKNQFKSYNVSLRGNYGVTSALSLGGEFSYGNVNGLDKDETEDFFSTNYLKAMIGGEAYLLNMLKFSELGNKFQPYGGLHLGIIQASVITAGSNELEDPVLFKGSAFAHQWHGGVKVKLSKTFDLNVRGTLLAMKSDDFDNQNADVDANRSNDALVNVEVGVTIHIGGKGKESIIWYNPNKAMEESLAIDTVLPVEFSLDEKLNLINTKRMQNEAKTAVEIAALQMEKNDLKSQLLALEKKVEELSSAAVSNSAPAKEPKVEANNAMPTESTIYEALLIGPVDADYFIVSGSYEILENAAQRVTELNQKGYTPVIMREPSANNLNRVVIDTANSFKKALQLVIKYKKELDPKAWIIKQKR